MKSEMNHSALRVEGLFFAYPGEEQLNFPDLEVTSDNPLLILGDSGCGKTTFLHLLSGLLNPDGGSVVLDGKNISTLNPAACDRFRGQNIGMIFQQPHFIEALTVYENLRISPYLSHMKQPLSALESSIQELNLSGLLNKLPSRLSSGEQQRVSIIRALMNRPKLILADEPTSALDNKNCAAVIELLIRKARQLNAVLIICTHDERIRKEVENELDLSDMTLNVTEKP